MNEDVPPLEYENILGMSMGVWLALALVAACQNDRSIAETVTTTDKKTATVTLPYDVAYYRNVPMWNQRFFRQVAPLPLESWSYSMDEQKGEQALLPMTLALTGFRAASIEPPIAPGEEVHLRLDFVVFSNVDRQIIVSGELLDKHFDSIGFGALPMRHNDSRVPASFALAPGKSVVTILFPMSRLASNDFQLPYVVDVFVVEIPPALVQPNPAATREPKSRQERYWAKGRYLIPTTGLILQ